MTPDPDKLPGFIFARNDKGQQVRVPSFEDYVQLEKRLKQLESKVKT